MRIASEQQLIAKINRLQQVKGELLKYEVLTEMRVLPPEPMGMLWRGAELFLSGEGTTQPQSECPLPIAGSLALVGQRPCSSTQGLASWSFLKGGAEDRQQHCQGATGCCT